MRSSVIMSAYPFALMVNFIVWLILGGIIGWLASIVMHTDAKQGLLMNVVVGIVGAYIGGVVISPLVGWSTINQNNFSLGALFVSFLGAVVLLGVINLLSRGTPR